MSGSKGSTGPRSPTRPRPGLLIGGGSGRLGSVIVTTALAQGYPVRGIVESARGPATARPPVVPISEASDLLDASDVYLTATTPAAEATNLPRIGDAGLPAVVATTGLGDPLPDWLAACARRVPIVLDANFSLGVHLLRRALRSLGPLPSGFDASIVETHRRGKVDHPSGTAISLAADLGRSGLGAWRPADGTSAQGRVEVASLRAGETPGVHVVQIAGPSELLRFEHLAYGREAFAIGMLAAADWLVREDPAPGIYSLEDVLGGGLA